MRKINFREVSKFILQYRNILLALGVSILVWNITSNPPSGELVLIANQYIPIGTKLDSRLFTEVHLSGFNHENLISNISGLQNKSAGDNLLAGTVLNEDLVSNSLVPNNRIDVFISLEQQLEINSGDKLHLWNLNDGYSQMVSQDAVVRRSNSDSYGTDLVVSVPLSDEYLVMQSQNIRITKFTN